MTFTLAHFLPVALVGRERGLAHAGLLLGLVFLAPLQRLANERLGLLLVRSFLFLGLLFLLLGLLLLLVLFLVLLVLVLVTSMP